MGLEPEEGGGWIRVEADNWREEAAKKGGLGKETRRGGEGRAGAGRAVRAWGCGGVRTAGARGGVECCRAVYEGGGCAG